MKTNYSFFNEDIEFNCGDGWFNILSDFAHAVWHLIDANVMLADFKISAVESQFGELTIYHNESGPVIRNLEREAARESRHTCEICGNPGMNRSTDDIVNTYCQMHYVEWVINTFK